MERLEREEQDRLAAEEAAKLDEETREKERQDSEI